MLKILLASAALALATAPVRAALPTFYDPNSASFADWPAVSVGATITGARALGARCYGSGDVTVQSVSGNNLLWSVTPGFQAFPGAVAKVVASTATCLFYNMH